MLDEPKGKDLVAFQLPASQVPSKPSDSVVGVHTRVEGGASPASLHVPRSSTDSAHDATLQPHSTPLSPAAATAPLSSVSIGERGLLDPPSAPVIVSTSDVLPLPTVSSLPSGFERLLAAKGADRRIRRQDHPRVRAIRLNEEDWREVDLERSSSARGFFQEVVGEGLEAVVAPMKDEEVYVSQLYRRAVLLNEEFQVRMRKAVARRFGERVQFHGARVKTKARIREKLLCYITPEDSQSVDEEEGDEPEMELPLAANILDPVRATVVCDGPAEMLEVAQWLLNHGEKEQIPVVRVKNKFAVKDANQ